MKSGIKCNKYFHVIKNQFAVCSEKMKPCGLVERPKFKFDRAGIQKPSHGMKQSLEDESNTYLKSEKDILE